MANGRTESSEPLQVTKLRQVSKLHREANMDTRLVGSWGRAAVFNTSLPMSHGDYGGHRDLDVVVLKYPNETVKTSVIKNSRILCSPVVFEEHFSSQISFTPNTSTIRYRDLSYEVDSEIFESYTVNFSDFVIYSFDPKTLLYLTNLYGPPRPKDTTVWEEFIPMAQKISRLPDYLFEPFRELERDRKRKYPNEDRLAQLRWEYHSKVPLRLRRVLATVTVPLWNRVTTTMNDRDQNE